MWAKVSFFLSAKGAEYNDNRSTKSAPNSYEKTKQE
jgi:hypothetical protein